MMFHHHHVPSCKIHFAEQNFIEQNFTISWLIIAKHRIIKLIILPFVEMSDSKDKVEAVVGPEEEKHKEEEDEKEKDPWEEDILWKTCKNTPVKQAKAST